MSALKDRDSNWGYSSSDSFELIASAMRSVGNAFFNVGRSFGQGYALGLQSQSALRQLDQKRMSELRADIMRVNAGNRRRQARARRGR